MPFQNFHAVCSPSTNQCVPLVMNSSTLSITLQRLHACLCLSTKRFHAKNLSPTSSRQASRFNDSTPIIVFKQFYARYHASTILRQSLSLNSFTPGITLQRFYVIVFKQFHAKHHASTILRQSLSSNSFMPSMINL